MKSWKQLQEEREEAMFALMLRYVFEGESDRLMAENERLQKDPEAQVPKCVDERCLRTIRRHFLK